MSGKRVVGSVAGDRHTNEGLWQGRQLDVLLPPHRGSQGNCGGGVSRAVGLTTGHYNGIGLLIPNCWKVRDKCSTKICLKMSTISIKTYLYTNIS